MRINVDRAIQILVGRSQRNQPVADDNPGIPADEIVGASTDAARAAGAVANLKYFDQTDGLAGNDGLTPATAKDTYANAVAIASPGDTIVQVDDTEVILEVVTYPLQASVGTAPKINNPPTNARTFTDIGGGAYTSYGDGKKFLKMYNGNLVFFTGEKSGARKSFYSENGLTISDSANIGAANTAASAPVWNRFSVGVSGTRIYAIRDNAGTQDNLAYCSTPSSWTVSGAKPGGFAGVAVAGACGRSAIVWVCTGSGTDQALRTTDGTTLSAVNLPGSGDYHSITYAKNLGIFMAVGASGVIATSADEGATWTQIAAPSTLGTGKIRWCQADDEGDRIILVMDAAAANPIVYTTIDGSTFTEVNISTVYGLTPSSIDYDSGYFWILCNPFTNGSTGANILRSVDGVTWTTILSGASRPGTVGVTTTGVDSICVYNGNAYISGEKAGPVRYLWIVYLGVAVQESILGYNCDASGLLTLMSVTTPIALAAKNISVTGNLAVSRQAEVLNTDVDGLICNGATVSTYISAKGCYYFGKDPSFVSSEIISDIGSSVPPIFVAGPGGSPGGISLDKTIVKSYSTFSFSIESLKPNEVSLVRSVCAGGGGVCFDVTGSNINIDINRTTIIGDIFIRGSFTLTSFDDVLVDGGIFSQIALTHNGGYISGQYSGAAVAGDNVFTVNPIFANTTDYRLSQIAAGDTFDSPLLGKSTNYDFSGRARDLGAWSFDRTGVETYYRKPFYLPLPDEGPDVTYSIENPDAEESIGDDGTPDEFNNPDRQVERVVIRWPKNMAASTLGFFLYVMRLRDLTALVSLDPRKKISEMVAQADGAHSAGDPVLAVAYTGTIISGARVTVGTGDNEYDYLVSYAIDDGSNSWRIILDRPLDYLVNNGDTVTLSWPFAFGEYVIKAPTVLEWKWDDAVRMNVFQGAALELVRKH